MLRPLPLLSLIALLALSRLGSAEDESSRQREPLLWDLKAFEAKLEVVDEAGLMTDAKERAVRAQLSALRSKFDLDRSPQGKGLSDGQLEELRIDLNALSGSLFRR